MQLATVCAEPCNDEGVVDTLLCVGCVSVCVCVCVLVLVLWCVLMCGLVIRACPGMWGQGVHGMVRRHLAKFSYSPVGGVQLLRDLSAFQVLPCPTIGYLGLVARARERERDFGVGWRWIDLVERVIEFGRVWRTTDVADWLISCR
eukprot:1774437-Rhodomonas_salina.2